MKRKVPHLLVWCVAIVMLGSNLFGDFRPPRFRFDHISRDGTLYFSEVWLEIDAGGGWKLPFAVNFDNTRTEISPYLGRGWRLSLLESHVIKESEKRFYVIMPSGYKYKFVRRAPEFYEGNGGWTCIGTPDDCVLKPSCGDDSITFKGGKIQSFFYAKRAFECVRDDHGLVKALVDPKTGTTVVECLQGPAGGLERLKFEGGEEIAIEQSLPKVPSSNAQDKERLVPSLSRISLKKRKTTKEYRSYIEDGEQVAGLRIESNHGFEKDFKWDVKTQKVLSDGDYSYRFEQVGGDFDQSRTDKDGVIQRWFENRKEGYEILKGFSHSPEVATRRFHYTKGAPAALLYQTRKIEEEKNGKWEVVKTFSHDDKGRVIGEIDHKGGTDIRTEFDVKGAATRKIHDLSGRLVKTTRLNEKGKPLEMELSDPRIAVRYAYGPDGALVGRTVTDNSPAQAQELHAFPSLLDRGLRYTAKGESVYPAETIRLHEEAGADPRTFSVRFVATYDSLGGKSSFAVEEWDGFDASMGKYRAGSDGKTYYVFWDNDDLTVSVDSDVATVQIYPVSSRLEFVTLPFGLFMKQGKQHKGYGTPRWRQGQDIIESLRSIDDEAKKHQGEKEFTIAQTHEDKTWRAVFISGNLYPKELVIECDGVPLFKWQVTQWSSNLGAMTFPKEIETELYMKGKVIRKTNISIQSIGPSEASDFEVPVERAATIRDLDTGAYFETGKAK